MGLCFVVGSTYGVFKTPYADQVQTEIEKQLQYSVSISTEVVFHSEEVGWSGWRKLQDRAIGALGRENVPNLLAMEAWQGVYFPLSISPLEIIIPGDNPPLQFGSLFGLVEELGKLAEVESFPTDDESLSNLWKKYVEDDDLVDTDMEVQTYIQLFLSARLAILHDLTLWVVK